MADVSYGSLPFSEQIAFFRRKLNLPTASWTDIVHEQHDHAFVVAGANKLDLVQDFRQAVDAAIANGETLQQFRKRFDEIVARHGWSYNGGRNWRSRVIYETNLRTSYAAGRYAQLQAVKKFMPFWQYVHSDAVVHPRPMHLAWNGLVLAADDPWWHTHFPPNGWGCQCTVHALDARDLKRIGKDGPDQAPPDNMQTVTVGINGPSPRVVETPAGVDPGFGYAPGKSAFDQLAESVVEKAIRLPALPGARALNEILSLPSVTSALDDGLATYAEQLAQIPAETTAPIGALDAPTVRALQSAGVPEPASASIVVRAGDLAPIVRGDPALAAQLENLPTRLRTPIAVLVDRTGALVYLLAPIGRQGGTLAVTIEPGSAPAQPNLLRGLALTDMSDVRARLHSGDLTLVSGGRSI